MCVEHLLAITLFKEELWLIAAGLSTDVGCHYLHLLSADIMGLLTKLDSHNSSYLWSLHDHHYPIFVINKNIM